ncbi:AIPR family protein [Rhodococcus sp. F64268]|uniref:AIPR family protein n=1 Tax=Rhodococcus sp. F64268 TaxID=2926402 RepID=UPI001FF5B363|nr:AIPR family protein [Rhodococcus sp. F64268]MCK0093738.1 AIPR family protein [Rhodococcus sp. F64268]
MGRLHVTQIEQRLQQTVMPHVDCSDLGAHGPEQQKQTKNSRSLAAFVIMKLGGVTETEAASAVTDESGDNGIDAIIALSEESRIVVTQSKWSNDSGGSAASSDMIKFREGIDDLLSLNWHKFGTKLQSKSSDLEKLLLDPNAKIDIVFAHLGTSDVAPAVAEIMDSYLAELNDPTEIGTFNYLNQGRIHKMLVEETEGTQIDLDVALSDWGVIEGPPAAYYGHVSASDISSWYQQHGKSILSKNVRVALSDSEVNDGLLKTLTTEPDKFWYFNNGITVLCERIDKSAAGGTDRRIGVFRATNASIVNGAQTASVLHKFKQQGGELSSVQVMARFISLNGAEETFSSEVTRATNTQNRIGGRDFVALDPQQKRIKDEFSVAGYTYTYRTGEESPSPESGCDLTQATVALACAHSPQLATQAKREISRLWDDIERAPYRSLFNGKTTYVRIWRCVEILRLVEDSLSKEKSTLEGRDRLVATHGNRAILNLIFSQLNMAKIDDPDYKWSNEASKVSTLLPQVLSAVIKEVTSNHPGYPASLFKNSSKVSALESTVVAHLKDAQ